MKEDVGQGVQESAGDRAATEAGERTHPSAMRATFSAIAEFLAGHLFSRVIMNEAAVEKIRELSARGTVVYVLRHRSFVDYVLLNYVLRRENLPLPTFANGIRSTLLAPVPVMLRRLRENLFPAPARGGTPVREGDHEYCRRQVAAGRPVLIFMRGRREGRGGRRWGRAASSPRVGSDYLREILHQHGDSNTEKFVVPLAPFRGHSFRRRQPGISALVYSVQEAPSDTRKLVAYWWNRRDLFITVGKEVDIDEFVERYSEDSEERLIRRLVRAVQIFLYREERVVLGPALLPRRRIKAAVLENADMDEGIRKIAEETHGSVSKLRKEAERYFDEMTADFNGILFGIIAYLFKAIWGRMFTGVEPVELEKVIDKVRHHPVVLVPCHRSHFDYLILTYLFHLNFVSPPHIAAGINMSFWPMGPLFRAAGAFFIRRTFGDNPVYKLVFRQYLSFLIREGYTQEFFIEGGRSRTGKIMTPRLGMLTAIVNAYLTGVRRDLYLVPVSIHYGRLVEEDVYQRELRGASKERESFKSMLQARSLLKQKYGTVYVSFADPISLNDALGDSKQRFAEGADVEEIEEEKRRFIQKLGFRLLREVNEASVAGATSMTSTVLLGAHHSGLRYDDFLAQARALAELTASQGVKPTSSLKRNMDDFRENLGFLERRGLVETAKRGSEQSIIISEGKRLALNFYKNNLIHAFLIPSLVSFCMLRGVPRERLEDEVRWWLDMFRYEFPLPDREELGGLIDAYVDHARQVGALEPNGQMRRDHPLATAASGVLDCFRDAYWVVARFVRDELGPEGMPEKTAIEALTKAYDTSLKLGEVSKSEGATTVMFGNALNRFQELGLIERRPSAQGKRDKTLARGAAFQETYDLVAVLGDALSSREREASDGAGLDEGSQ